MTTRTTGKKISSESLKALNEKYWGLSPAARIQTLFQDFNAASVLVTSSFGTRSAMLLHFLQTLDIDKSVYWVDTGYHFDETIAYKNTLSKQLDLNVKTVYPDREQHALTTQESWWEEHPKMCCAINKITPLEPIIAQHDVWISSLMSYQTVFRGHLDIFERQGDIIKFHPLIDVDLAAWKAYMQEQKLPEHPLERQGYGSVGCTHCTVPGEGRAGRWKGKDKDECGLHPHYFINNQK